MVESENVSDSNIAIQIGKNIRFFRKVKGYTLKALADQMSNLSGQTITGTAIGFWERGEKNPTAVQLHYLALSLGIKEQVLYNLDGMYAGTENISEIRSMMNYAYRWTGNRKALIQFIKLYMCLQKHDRSDIAGLGISIYHEAKKANRLESEAPEIDVSYLESEWNKLMR